MGFQAQMDLQTRLHMLCRGGAISRGVLETMLRVLARLSDHWGLVLDEQNGSRLVTHLAMALMRIAQGQAIAAMDREAYGEFTQHESFASAAAITADLIEWARLDIPESEREFLISNLCLVIPET